MKLYKYRAIAATDDTSFQRLSDILCKNQFWCAAPSSLNDPDEFIWQCDYNPTEMTVSLLAELLVTYRKKDPAVAHMMACASIGNRRLQTIARPFIDQIIDECRSQIGLACFGTSSDNPIMWQRYGGKGAGVCIELDVPQELLNKQLFYVEYPLSKVLHIDQLLDASLSGTQKQLVYSVSLLSKPRFWATEAEIRFISKQQNVPVRIERSTISRLILGPRLDPAAKLRVHNLVASLSYELPLSYRLA